MPSLFVPADRESVALRLAALEPDSSRRWGKMDSAQMLLHCALALEAATGVRPRKQAFIGRMLGPFIRPLLLGKRPFGRNSPTDPAFMVTGPQEFETGRIRLATLLDRFVQRGPEKAGQTTHPFFGRLSGDEWGLLMHKHLDHHLRQFGC